MSWKYRSMAATSDSLSVTAAWRIGSGMSRSSTWKTADCGTVDNGELLRSRLLLCSEKVQQPIDVLGRRLGLTEQALIPVVEPTLLDERLGVG